MRLLRRRPLQPSEALRLSVIRQRRQRPPREFGVDVKTDDVIVGWVLTWLDGGDMDEDGTIRYGPHPHYAIDVQERLWRRVSLAPIGTRFALYEQIDLLETLESSPHLRKFFRP
jgi:hypothetical protein